MHREHRRICCAAGSGVGGEISARPAASAIANAIDSAVGVRLMELPITAEKVLAGLRARQTQAL